MSAGTFAAPVAGAGFVALKSNSSNICHGVGSTEWNKKIVSNGSKTHCMKTWNPINNKKFETFSYLPPVSDDSIAKQIDNMLKKEWTPRIEFERTARCGVTMMEGIVHCGSYQCLAALTHLKY